MSNIYITTTLPYVNADPHIGLALELIQADALARYHRAIGSNVIFNFGTDEHGLKIYRMARESDSDPKTYVDEKAKVFDKLKKILNLSYDKFIRTTNEKHITAAQEFWKICDKNGYIYKKNYVTKYCVGCELEKTDSELKDGKCPLHKTRELETINEENYFFRFSEFQNKLLKLYKNNPDFVVPAFRQKEIENFVKGGLSDFSISRLKSKMPWGIPVPGDDDHVMYVWFDALINYISTIGWPEDKNEFEKWWPVIQFAGKDNLRQQSAIWQAMLSSVDLPFSKQIFIHGFISYEGERMSKSLGNVVDPCRLVKDYDADTLRYFLLAKVHPFKDSDFTDEKFENTYNDDLANGLGNLVARIIKLLQINKVKLSQGNNLKFSDKISSSLMRFRFDEAMDYVWQKISELDKYINIEEPWKNDGRDKTQIWKTLISGLYQIAFDLSPFMPNTSESIKRYLANPSGSILFKPLFPKRKID